MLKLTDVRCPHCGAKLCERIELERGKVQFTCRKCHRTVTYQEPPPKPGTDNR